MLRDESCICHRWLRSDYLEPLGRRRSLCDSRSCAPGITRVCQSESARETPTGEIVLDLGVGGGIDVLLSARCVGPTGQTFGLDRLSPVRPRHLSRSRGFSRSRTSLRRSQRPLPENRTGIGFSCIGTALVYTECSMPDEQLKEILLDIVTLLSSLETEVRSLQVLTTHRVDASTNEKLRIPQQANALHVQLESLREKVHQFAQR